jgi:putative endonuclease
MFLPGSSDMAKDDCRVSVGKLGEDVACEALQRLGYAILARRFRTRAGEIDIVAREGSSLVFVEVKARRTTEFGYPLEAVTYRKRRRLCAMAAEYLARCAPRLRSCRFDVVSVLLEGSEPRVDVVRSAFDLHG